MPINLVVCMVIAVAVAFVAYFAFPPYSWMTHNDTVVFFCNFRCCFTFKLNVSSWTNIFLFSWNIRFRCVLCRVRTYECRRIEINEALESAPQAPAWIITARCISFLILSWSIREMLILRHFHDQKIDFNHLFMISDVDAADLVHLIWLTWRDTPNPIEKPLESTEKIRIASVTRSEH